MSNPKMTLANKITVARLIGIIFVVILVANSLFLPGFIVFIVVSLTDFLDGFVARKFNQITDLGKILDPIADKILVYSTMGTLLYIGHLNIYLFVFHIFRDFLIGAIRDHASSRGVVIPASFIAKVKTSSQILGLVFILFGLYDNFFHAILIGNVVLWLSLLASWYSFFQYTFYYIKSGKISY